MPKPTTPKTVATLKHDADKRKNIPTAEHRSVLKADDAEPRALKYLRNTDLDPQLVWRGKDEQDWSDLVVHAPPLYIQEKVHPKVLIAGRTPAPQGEELGLMKHRRDELGRRGFLAQAGLGMAALAAGRPAPARAAAADRPNVVFLLADQWRAKALGYEGDPNVRTPNLDRLAAESLNFRNVVSVCPVCTPQRASLMTGRFPTSTGMFLNDAHLPDEEVCLAETFRAAGYRTAYIGKWHLDGHGRTSFIPPARRQGWDYWKGAECDHNYPHSHYYTDDSPDQRFWDGYDAFAQTQDAIGYLRGRAADRSPFVLFVAYGTPHFPHGTAPEACKALYPPDKIRLPPNVPPAQEAAARREAQGYYGHCTALDRCVGEIVAALDDTKLAENTILVFSSDHGEMLGSHGCPPFMKQVPYDESARVPLLVRHPAAWGRQGRAVRTPLTTPDLHATLLGLAGVAVPRAVEGADLSADLKAGRLDGDRAALYMLVAPFDRRSDQCRAYRAIRTRTHTFARDSNGPWLLFDDARDPHQMENLAGRPEHAALQQELEARLQAELKKIGDGFLPARDYIALWGYEVAEHGSVPYNPKANEVVKPQTPRRRT